MPRAAPLSDDPVRRLRVAAQHLHRPRRRSVVELVTHLCGVQAQVRSAAGLALRARTTGLKAEQVEQARVVDRSIVITWAMRGTLHLIAAEDYGWLVPLVTEPSVANAHRRLKQEAVPADQPAKAVRLIARMLEREGPLTRAQIAERLRRQGIHVAGQAIAHLVWLAAAEVVICFGPDRDGDQCFVLVKDWLGETKPMERDKALAELALRYLKAHAPARPADLAFWSGIRMGDATRAWKSIADRLVEVETVRGTRWSPRAASKPAPSGTVRLLPAFDEYLLGWSDREVAVSAEHNAKINRGGGWLHPVVLANGRVVATWRAIRTPKKLNLEIAPFSRLTPVVGRGAAAEAEEVAAFLGVRFELTVV
jgi:DNA glycosylase AlkZ-like